MNANAKSLKIVILNKRKHSFILKLLKMPFKPKKKEGATKNIKIILLMKSE